jgi:hypothetical protein
MLGCTHNDQPVKGFHGRERFIIAEVGMLDSVAFIFSPAADVGARSIDHVMME